MLFLFDSAHTSFRHVVSIQSFSRYRAKKPNSIIKSILYSWYQSFGERDIDEDEVDFISQASNFVFILLVSVLLINLLIAILNNKYEEVRQTIERDYCFIQFMELLDERQGTEGHKRMIDDSLSDYHVGAVTDEDLSNKALSHNPSAKEAAQAEEEDEVNLLRVEDDDEEETREIKMKIMRIKERQERLGRPHAGQEQVDKLEALLRLTRLLQMSERKRIGMYEEDKRNSLLEWYESLRKLSLNQKHRHHMLLDRSGLNGAKAASQTIFEALSSPSGLKVRDLPSFFRPPRHGMWQCRERYFQQGTGRIMMCNMWNDCEDDECRHVVQHVTPSRRPTKDWVRCCYSMRSLPTVLDVVHCTAAHRPSAPTSLCNPPRSSFSSLPSRRAERTCRSLRGTALRAVKHSTTRRVWCAKGKLNRRTHHARNATLWRSNATCAPHLTLPWPRCAAT